MSLSWTPPVNYNRRIDNYQLRTIIGNQLFSVVLNDTSFTINSLSYFETIIVELAIVNCAGVGAESNITVVKGIQGKVLGPRMEKWGGGGGGGGGGALHMPIL